MRRSGSALILLLSAVFAVQAQSTGGSGFTLVPRISLTETWTDNLQADGAGGSNGSNRKDAALTTAVAPGVTISSRTGRIRGNLDYALNAIVYAKSAQKNRIDHQLAAFAVAELLENTFFIDTRANISQQSVSAFGQQTASNSLSNANRNQVATLSLAPYLRGQLAGLANLELRGNVTESNTKASIIGDSRNTGGALNVSSIGSGSLGWSANATTQRVSFKAGTSHRTEAANLGLRYRLDSDLRLGLSGGSERNDLLGTGEHSSATYGVNAQWTPSPRTTVVADWQKHDYGNAHTLSFDHRMARTAWRFSDSQSVTLGTGTGATGVGNNYDLLFLQFASQEPDPIKRDALVRSTLQTLSLSPNAVATSGFITASPTLLRRQELSVSLQGLRTTMTALLSRSTSMRLGAATTLRDDFSQSTRIMQRGASVSAAYRLTPVSTLTFSVSEQRSRGDAVAQSTTFRSIIASWNGRLGIKSTISVGARLSDFDGLVPYRENAVFASLVQQF